MYILDIETRGDKKLLEVYIENITAPKTYKDPDKIAEYIENKKLEASKGMAVDPDFNEIICIGIKEAGKPGVLMTLQEYATWLKQSVPTTEGSAKIQNLFRKTITFNGKQFDIPVILRNGIKQGIDLPYFDLMQQCDKYKAKNHIDLMQELSIGYGNYKSLDKYLQIYLGIKKTEIDFNTASESEIRTHCLEDLENTAKIYNLFAPLFTYKSLK
jgi:uncharacterized protein YprB with RNaseH-like and TPR domain